MTKRRLEGRGMRKESKNLLCAVTYFSGVGLVSEAMVLKRHSR